MCWQLLAYGAAAASADSAGRTGRAAGAQPDAAEVDSGGDPNAAGPAVDVSALLLTR